MKRVITVLVVVGWLCAPALSDWRPGDPHKMHFPQLPDPTGWDVNATAPKVLADDWECSATGWITGLHWWGSWKDIDGDLIGDQGTIVSFNLSIHDNIPGPGFSRPGNLLWEREITNFQPVPIDPPTQQGWYDPNTGQFNMPDHSNYFQYNLFLDPMDWFWQDAGTIYWLNISARVLETDRFWGWKSSQDHFMDDAVMGHLPGGPPWVELFEPPMFMQSLDLAFVVTPEPASLLLLAIGGATMLRRRR
jgi:hypothetical protein